MVLIKRLAINNIPESSFSTACAVGKFHFNDQNTDYLIGSSSELIFRNLPPNCSYQDCSNAEIVRQQDDGSTISIGKIKKIHSLVSDIGNATTHASVLISIEDTNSIGGIHTVANSDIPTINQQIKINTQNGTVNGSVTSLDAEFQPVSAANAGVKVVQAFEVDVLENSLKAQDSGSPVLDINNKLLGMFVMTQSSVDGKDRAFCIKTENLIFM